MEAVLIIAAARNVSLRWRDFDRAYNSRDGAAGRKIEGTRLVRRGANKMAAGTLESVRIGSSAWELHGPSSITSELSGDEQRF